MKKYITPTITTRTITLCSMIAGSPTLGYTNDAGDNTKSVLSNGRRDAWDGWDEE